MNIKGMRYVYRQESGEEGEAGGGSGAEVVVDQVDGVAPEIIDKATKMGWTPKDQFKGDPDKWRPANEFVERGENMLPIMRKNVERQEKKIAELERTVREFAEFNTKTETRAYERALRDLKAKQLEAVSVGDTAAFQQVDQEIATLQKEAAEKPKISVPEPGDDPEFQEWAEKNKWATTDPKLAAYAETYGEYLRRTGSKLVGTAFLDEVAKAVKKEFPDKFTNPRRTEAPSVEGSAAPAKKGGKSYADLPADAKASCDRMAKNGFSNDPKMAAEFKANFVKQYFEG